MECLHDTPVPGQAGFGLAADQRTALLHHARAELQQSRLGAASEAARALTVLDPLFAAGWEVLATVHERCGRQREAEVARQVAAALEGA